MRVLIFGPTGMLGRALVRTFRFEGDTVYESPHAAGAIDSLGYVHSTIEAIRPDVVINAAGVIPLLHRPTIETIRANALGPHVVAAACFAHGAMCIHVSTDCVFSGKKTIGNWYRDDEVPDPSDLYGWTKAAGEPLNAVVLRTSFVGPQHGLWRWLREQPPGATVEGYRHAMWSGSTVDAVARAICYVAHTGTPPGTYHLATESPIPKYDVVSMLASMLSLGINVKKVDEPVINRGLRPSRLMPVLQPFVGAISQFVQEAVQ